MKKFLAAAAAVTTLFVAAPAMAQTIDGSIGYSSIDADVATLGGLTGRLSIGIGDIFGIEGEATLGIGDDQVVEQGVRVDLELKHQAAIYGTVGAPIGETGRIFARVGFGTQEIEGSSSIGGGAAVTSSVDETSINYGVGAQFMFAGPNGVRVDYTRIDLSDDGGEADVWSISYIRRFR